MRAVSTLKVAESEVELGKYLIVLGVGASTVRHKPQRNIETGERGGLILLVEDDENDVALVQRAFAKAGASAAMKVVKSAEEAMAYLKNEPPYANREENPAPALVPDSASAAGGLQVEVTSLTRRGEALLGASAGAGN